MSCVHASGVVYNGHWIKFFSSRIHKANQRLLMFSSRVVVYWRATHCTSSDMIRQAPFFSKDLLKIIILIQHYGNKISVYKNSWTVEMQVCMIGDAQPGHYTLRALRVQTSLLQAYSNLHELLSTLYIVHPHIYQWVSSLKAHISRIRKHFIHPSKPKSNKKWT